MQRGQPRCRGRTPRSQGRRDGQHEYGQRASGVAIGNGVSVAGANFDNSVAIGNGGTATRANQQVYGTASNTYTMPGITSTASHTAQSGPTQIVTSDASGNLATSTLAGLGLASNADIAGINSQLNNLNNRINALIDEARAGTALALSTSGLHYDPRPGKASLAAAFDNYKGQSGVAVGFGFAFTDRFRVNGAFTGTPQVNELWRGRRRLVDSELKAQGASPHI